MGRKYHVKDFPKGELGEISKIQEELDELKDSKEQGSKIMEMVELCDLYGAIECYLQKYHPSTTMDDLKTFSFITKRSYENDKKDPNNVDFKSLFTNIDSDKYYKFKENFCELVKALRTEIVTMDLGYKMNGHALWSFTIRYGSTGEVHLLRSELTPDIEPLSQTAYETLYDRMKAWEKKRTPANTSLPISI